MARPADASTSPVGRGLVRTPAARPEMRQDRSVARSEDLANVRTQRRSVAPPYSTRSAGASEEPARSVQTLFRTS